MAKRSDFAQKLLDDLRLRKERMAAASQGSNTANSMVSDAYAYSKRTYRGSKELKTNGMTGSPGGDMQGQFSGGNKSLIRGETSNQITHFGRGQNSEKFGDLSMALAFSLENGGKVTTRMDSSGSASVLGFLQQIGRTSIDYGKTERRSSVDRHQPPSSSFPTVSYLHVKEISKGAQKLNEILRACSNGLNFDSCSIEIGKELLKGAMDLEESLRMLVHLQEASDYMISPQRKSRITLLEDEEDDDSNSIKVAEPKQLDRPTFSFDKPSRNYHDIRGVARTDLKLRLAALAYPSEANFSYGFATSNSSSHKRSTSYSPDVNTLTIFTDKSKQLSPSQSKPEKRRIPNVVAKLMGLEELPENVDSKEKKQKDSATKPKIEGMVSKKRANSSTKKAEQKTIETENLAPPTVKQKVIQTSRSPSIQDVTALQAEKNLATRNNTSEMVNHDEKLSWKDLERTRQVMGSQQTTIRRDKQQRNISELHINAGSHKDIQEKEKEQDNAKHGEKEVTEKDEAKEPVLKDEPQWVAAKMHKRPDVAVTFQEGKEYQEGTFQTENRYSNKLLFSNKPQRNLGYQQSLTLQRSENQEKNHQAEEREKNTAKQKLQLRKQKGCETLPNRLSKSMPNSVNVNKKKQHMNQAPSSRRSSRGVNDATQSKRYGNSRSEGDLAMDGSSTSSNVNRKDSMNKNSEHNSSSKDTESESAEAHVDMKDKPVEMQAMQKAKEAKMSKSEIPRKINEVMTRRNGSMYNLASPLKQQNSILQEVKQRKQDKLSVRKEADQVRASRSIESKMHVKSRKSVANIQPLDVAQQLQKEVQEDPLINAPGEDECQSLNEPQTPATTQAPADSAQDKISRLTNQQTKELVCGRDEELNYQKTVPDTTKGTHEGSRDIFYTSELEHQKISMSESPEPLTESENHLKQILVKSQLFLNTAEALFKLNIPVGILHAGEHDYHDEDSKLILDCGYEVMKRKGRQQELRIHPFMEVSMTSMKVRSFDNLVKELHRDFEKLKFYGRNGNAESVVEFYLPKMLEIDIHIRDPDVNCMWDFGWNDMMFAFIEKDDAIRDVVRYILNGLLDELVRDLLCI